MFRIIADDSDPMEEHASVKQLQQSAEQGGAVTLEECFQVCLIDIAYALDN